MLELKNVSYKYQDGTEALKDVSFLFEMGKCYCINGPNGSGKSTLFRILNALSFPTSGEYLFRGDTVTPEKMKDKRYAAELHRSIGYVFQNSEMQLFTKSVEDEIAFGLYQMELDEKEIKERTEKYISLLDLEKYREKAPFNLSGGEKKRTALAAVMAMEPPVLILDEPISGLDDEGQEWVSNFLESLKSKDRLLIIATHNKELTEFVSDHTIIMTKDHSIL